MKEICVGDGGKAVHHLSNAIGATAIISTMNETAQTKREQRIVPSKRKSAFPEKKSKRKMAQASRKRNR
jgi:hypothetical protein